MSGSNLLEVKDLNVTFSSRTGIAIGKRRADVHAVRGVSFEIEEGQTLGLVGESGSGKTTIGRAILRLVDPSSGEITFRGEDMTRRRGRDLREYRSAVQPIFQDPYSSLNPSMTVSRVLREAIVASNSSSRRNPTGRVRELLEWVGLGAEAARRYPHEFSGGQRQRIAIARALASEPDVIVCDEAVSALDVSTQSQVLELLRDIQRRTGVSYLFIAHDLGVVRYMSDEVVVLYKGRVMEQGPADRIHLNPAHPYTARLIAAIPEVRPDHREASRLARRMYSAYEEQGASTEQGCPFSDQCRFVLDECISVMPERTPVIGGGSVACFLQSQGPKLSGRPLSCLGAEDQ